MRWFRFIRSVDRVTYAGLHDLTQNHLWYAQTHCKETRLFMDLNESKLNFCQPKLFIFILVELR